MGKLETPEGPVHPVARPLGDLLVVGPIRNHWPLVFLTFLPFTCNPIRRTIFLSFYKPLVTGKAGFQSTWTLVGGETVRNHWPLVFTLPPYCNKTCNRQNRTSFFHFFLSWVTGETGFQTTWTLCRWWGTIRTHWQIIFLFITFFLVLL